jgi:hypothetical protein
MADTQAQTFLKEVDEHLHYEKMVDLWKKYKNILFASLAILFIAVGGFKYYTQQKEVRLSAQASNWWDVAISETPEAAKLAIGKVVTENAFGYRMLGHIQLAKLAIAENNNEVALKELHAIKTDKDVDALHKDMASFFEGQILMQTDYAKAKTIFTSLDNVQSPFRVSALEMLAMMAETQGSKTEAVALYERIAETKIISPNMRGRAQARIRLLKAK